MNNDRILEQIKNDAVCGAPLDFSDLLARIEKDGGRSTAEVAVKRRSAGKVIGTAASVVLATGASAALLGVLAVAATGGMASSEADCALDSAIMNEEAEIAEDSASDDFFSQNDMETSVPMPSDTMVDEEPEETVSDGDVSDSDVSDSDLPEEESYD